MVFFRIYFLKPDDFLLPHLKSHQNRESRLTPVVLGGIKKIFKPNNINLASPPKPILLCRLLSVYWKSEQSIAMQD